MPDQPTNLQQKRRFQKHLAAGGKLQSWERLLPFFRSSSVLFLGGTLRASRRPRCKKSSSPCCRFRISLAIH